MGEGLRDANGNRIAEIESVSGKQILRDKNGISSRRV
jgi:hypothetical protein